MFIESPINMSFVTENLFSPEKIITRAEEIKAPKNPINLFIRKSLLYIERLKAESLHLISRNNHAILTGVDITTRGGA